MKIIILTLCAGVSLCGCSAQNNQMNIPKITIPKLTKKFEKFDIKEFVEEVEAKDLSYIDTPELSPLQVVSLTIEQKNELSHDEFKKYSWLMGAYQIETITDAYVLEKFRDSDTLNYIKFKIYPDSPVAVKKEFYSNGNIKFKYLEYHNDELKIGFRYEYNEAGEFVQKTDLEEGYKFRFIGVLKYLRANQVDLPLGVEWGGARFPIVDMLDRGGKKVWALSYRKFRLDEDQSEVGSTTLCVYCDILDGQTGELIKSSHLPFIPYEREWLFP